MSLLANIQSGKENKPPRLLVYGSEGIGKAQPLDAQVLTPEGFVAMGELKVGDRVIGVDGKPRNILAIFPQGKKEVFRVHFRDGSQTECCDEHLWFTQTRGERERHQPGAVRTLNTIRRTLRYGTHFNHAVPRVAPVEFAPGAELPVSPWLLGVYLGDGNMSGCPLITNPEEDIRRRITESIDESDATSPTEKAIRIRKRLRGHEKCIFAKALQEFDLDKCISDTKFIPERYLLASVEDRLELLRGLCDSDGYVAKPGAVEISTASAQMAKDIMFLVRSLGGSITTRTRQGRYRTPEGMKEVKLSYRLYFSFTNGIVPVASEKHTARWSEPEWTIRHSIRKVEAAGKKKCQCLVIDALDGLYVTDDFIVTHNSTFGSGAPGAIFIPTEDGLGEIDCHRFPLCRSLSEVMACLNAVRREEHSYQTLVIDSLDWLERLIFDEVCREYGVRSIEKADGGYARGYVHALTHWRKILTELDGIRNERNMAIILLAHAKIEKFEDPESSAYDRYSPRLHKHATSLISEWVDAVLFATKRFRVQKENAGFNGERAIAAPIGADGGERYLRTIGSPACVAKNRYSLPGEIPLSWEAFIAALNAAPVKK